MNSFAESQYQPKYSMALKLSAYGNKTQVYYSKANKSNVQLTKLSKIYEKLLPKNTKFTESDDLLKGKYNWLT